MDEAVVARMKEVDGVVRELDPEVRGAAFAMMQSYVLGGKIAPPEVHRHSGGSTDGAGGADDGGAGDAGDDSIYTFFADLKITKPSEAVYAIAGYHYSVYGSAPFTIERLRDLAGQVGLTLPDDPGATLRMATKNKKSLFRHEGGGAWVPTTMGELFLKEKFDIKKGRRKPPAAEDPA